MLLSSFCPGTALFFSTQWQIPISLTDTPAPRVVQHAPSSLSTSFSTQDATPKLCKNTSLLNPLPCTMPRKQISHWEASWNMGMGSSPWSHGGGVAAGRAAPPVPPVLRGAQNESPLYGPCLCRFDLVLTHQPPAPGRKCHFSDTHPCRSVSSQGNKSSKQRNATALDSQAQSCSLLSHSQAAAIPDIHKFPTSMQRRYPIKILWDHCQPVFLCATKDQGSVSFLKVTSQGSWSPPLGLSHLPAMAKCWL